MKVGFEVNTLAQNFYEDAGAVLTSTNKKKINMNYSKALERLLGQSDKDYFVLTRKADKPANPPKNICKTFAQGLKNFFEKGCMF